MAITPLDIHNKEFHKAFRGYDEEEVDEYLEVLLKEYEKVFRENAELKEVIAAKDSNIGQYKDLEETLKKTLVVAQQAADEVKLVAHREAEVILREAHLKAEQVVAAAEEKAKSLLRHYEDIQKEAQLFKVKFRSFLQCQLDMISENEDIKLNIVESA